MTFAKEMKRLILIILFLATAFTCAGENAVRTDAKISTHTVEVGQQLMVTIETSNTSNKKQFFPANVKYEKEWRVDGGGIDYSTDESGGVTTRFSISSSPPIFHWIEAGEKKKLLLSWTVPTDRIGTGYIFVALPLGFEPVKPIHITITNKANKSEQATPRKPSD